AVGIEAALLNVKRGDQTVLEDVLSWKSDRDRLYLISRYEGTPERSLYKALHELQRLQATREGQTVLLPQTVDLEVSVSGTDPHGPTESCERRIFIPHRNAGRLP